MEKLTPERLKALFPETWWAVWRAGFAECKNDPETRKQIAEEYLKNSLTQPSPAATATKPIAQPRVQGAPRISAEQAAVNKQLDLDPQTFAKYANETPSRLDPEQTAMNRVLGVREEDFLKYHKPRSA